MSSWGSSLLDPKKLQNEQFYIIDWIRKKLLVDVANLATCCHDDYDVLLKVLGTMRKCYVSSPVAKTLEIMTGTTVFGCLPGAHTLAGPKKASKRTILHNRLNMEKNSWSMLPIWLLAAMMIMMYYLRFWEPCANAMLVVLLPKFWFGLKIMTGHNCFWMSSWGSPLLDPKKLQNQQFYKIDWIRKNSWSMLPIWLLAAMIMMYYWRFWEPWANAMLVVLLPKLWKSWLAQLFLDVFLGLTLTGPKQASKRTILHDSTSSSSLQQVARLATSTRSFFHIQSIM